MSARSKEYTFTSLAVADKELAWFAVVDDGMAEQKLDHAVMLRRLGEKWGQKKISKSVCASCFMKDSSKLLNVGVDGTVFVFDLPDVIEETVDNSDRGPSELVALRTARSIGGKIFAAGMARMVYRRDGDGLWTAIDAGVFVEREQRERSSGFLAIDGLAEDEICAAGYHGEIWVYDGVVWEQQSSPTNVTLTAMTVGPNNEIHIVGLAGLYIVGRRGAWEVVDHGLHEDDFWGVTNFDGTVYCATLNDLFRHVPGGLEPVNMQLDQPVTTAYLDARQGVMWSAGYKDLVRTEDGVTWTIVETP